MKISCLILCNRESSCSELLGNIKSLEKKLKDSFENYEINIVSSSSNNYLIKYCGSDDAKYKKYNLSIVDSTNYSEYIKIGTLMCTYKYVWIISANQSIQMIDIKTITERFSYYNRFDCFSAYESQNIRSGNLSGVVVSLSCLKDLSNLLNSSCEDELFKQIEMLCYYLGNVYRVNNLISMFRLYPTSLFLTKHQKFKFWFVRRNCMKKFNLKEDSSKNIVILD